MSYTAKDYLPTWSSEADFALSKEQIENRIRAIHVMIAKEKKVDFWLDIVRLSHDVPAKDAKNVEKLIGFFKGADPSIAIIGNKHLVKVLSCISLCFLLEGVYTEYSQKAAEDGTPKEIKKQADVDVELACTVALAILNINFLGQYSVIVKIPCGYSGQSDPSIPLDSDPSFSTPIFSLITAA